MKAKIASILIKYSDGTIAYKAFPETENVRIIAEITKLEKAEWTTVEKQDPEVSD